MPPARIYVPSTINSMYKLDLYRVNVEISISDHSAPQRPLQNETHNYPDSKSPLAPEPRARVNHRKISRVHPSRSRYSPLPPTPFRHLAGVNIISNGDRCARFADRKRTRRVQITCPVQLLRLIHR